MSFSRLTNKIPWLLATVVAMTLGIHSLQAQNWKGPIYPSPKQEQQPITQQGDNLGGSGALCDADTSVDGCMNWTHRARYNIDMNYFPITAIGDGGANTGATAKPALEAESVKGITGLDVEGALVGAHNGLAIYAETNSATQAALGAFYRGNADPGYGIWTESPTGLVSAIISGRLSLTDQNSFLGTLQIGPSTSNRLSVVQGSSLADPVYYGQASLCKPDGNGQCGFGNQGYSVMDNLGLTDPHTAMMNLNLHNNRIINISSNTTQAGLTAKDTGVDAGTRVINTGYSSTGVSAALYGFTNSEKAASAGIYAYQSSIAPALVAGSNSGWAARIYGRLQVAGPGQPQMQFGQTNNSLSTAAQILASNDLYWGNNKLCTAGSVNCGWSPGNGNLERWKVANLNQENIFFKNYLNAGVPLSHVGIGTASPQFELDVVGSSRLAGTSIGILRASSVTVTTSGYLGNDLYVANDATVNDPGVTVDGTISVGANGLTIGGVRLSENDLKAMITACQNSGICT